MLDRLRQYLADRRQAKADAARQIALRELTAAQPARLREIEYRQALDAEAKVLRVSGRIDDYGRKVTPAKGKVY